MSEMLEKVAHRFWSKVQKGGADDCWQWLGCKNERGYGSVNVSGKTAKSHRVAWQITNGRPIPAGMFVCHTCDNPSCCNPRHLWLGTPKDNVYDMMAKGRSVRPQRDERLVAHKRGEESYLAKLTEEAVLSIRERRANGERLTSIANEYGVDMSLISKIAKRRCWRHLP